MQKDKKVIYLLHKYIYSALYLNCRQKKTKTQEYSVL